MGYILPMIHNILIRYNFSILNPYRIRYRLYIKNGRIAIKLIAMDCPQYILAGMTEKIIQNRKYTKIFPFMGMDILPFLRYRITSIMYEI